MCCIVVYYKVGGTSETMRERCQASCDKTFHEVVAILHHKKGGYATFITLGMTPPSLTPFKSTGCTQITCGLDGVIWKVGPDVVFKTAIRYDFSSYIGPDVDMWMADSAESHDSINWEKAIYEKLDCNPSPRLVRSLLHIPEGIFLEYHPGGNLWDCLRSGRALSARRKVQMFEDVVNAVADLSSRGLYHGDLRPENFLLDTSGRLKLCDFAGTVPFGTPLRRLPAPLLSSKTYGDIPVAEETDQIFASAYCLYLILTGNRPYEDRQPFDAVSLFRQRQFPSIPTNCLGMLSPLGQIVQRCWKREYQDIAALTTDVRLARRSVLSEDSDQDFENIDEQDLQRKRATCQSFVAKAGFSPDSIAIAECEGDRPVRKGKVFNSRETRSVC
jgi:serine/threonine protein kinase